MNKAQLIDALAERLGDRKAAATAVAALVDVVVRTVHGGERVTITGFGVFEKRARAARTARNPRTGQTVTVQQTNVPAFRPGTLFREVVSGTRALPETGAGTKAVAARSAANAPSRPVTKVTAATRPATVRVAPAKEPKAAKTVKAGKAEKAGKAAEAAKAEPKATKDNTKGPAKATTKKAGKKSASKK